MIGAVWIGAATGALFAVAAAAETRPPAPLDAQGPAYAAPWKRHADWPQTLWPRFGNLAQPAASPPPPPPGVPRKIEGAIDGDAAKGKRLAFDRSRGGSCAVCHVLGPETPSLPGNVGPDLSEIAKAGRTDEWFYNYLYDPRVYNAETVMPPWGAHGVFDDGEIRDIVAYLKTLSAPADFKNDLENPARRPVPREERDNLDPLANPAMFLVEKAQALYRRRLEAGFSCYTCHGPAEARFKGWAAAMPKWEPRLGKVLGVEEFVFRHAKATTGGAYPMQGEDNLALAVFLRFLANGVEIKIDLSSEGARAAAARGKASMETKLGQLNFACVDCHTAARSANKWIRGQWLTESRGHMTFFPTWRTSRSETWDIRKRFQWCNVAVRADELPPDAKEYGDLELYLVSLNDGLKLNAPGIRH